MRDANAMEPTGLLRGSDVGPPGVGSRLACLVEFVLESWPVRRGLLFESSLLCFQGRCLIIDWRKVRRYEYYRAEGHRGTGGDSWEGPPHHSHPGQTVHFQACGHLKKSNSCGEFKAGPGADMELVYTCRGPAVIFQLPPQSTPPPHKLPPALIHWNHSL